MGITDRLFQMKNEKAAANLKAGEEFLEANKTKEGVVTLPSGLQYQVLSEGDGAKPSATSKVTCHYHGTLIDGTVFDSSVQRGQPATFPLNMVIKAGQKDCSSCRQAASGVSSSLHILVMATGR